MLFLEGGEGGTNRQCYVRFVMCKQNHVWELCMCLHVNTYCNILFRIIVPFPGVFLDGFRNTNWLCVGYTVKYVYWHVLIEFQLANNMIFDHEPWELNNCFSADHSEIMFTSTLPGCESEIADSDASGHTMRKDAYSESERKCVRWWIKW